MFIFNRFKMPRFFVFVSMVFVVLLSLFSLQIKAQTCVFGTGNRIAGTWHSDLYIAGNTITGSNDLYGWGQDMPTLVGLSASVSGGTDVFTPTKISSGTYSGTALEVRGSSPTTSTNVFGLRTSTDLYIFGDDINALTNWSGFGGTSLSTGNVTSKLPSGVTISNIKEFRISTTAIALLTNTGEVYMLSTKVNLRGDFNVAEGSVWHKVKLSDGTTPLSNVTKLSVSGSGVLALTSTGTLYYWGDGNPYGSPTTPTAYNYAFDISSAVPAGTTISDVLVAGKTRSNLFLLCADGFVYSCGTNDNGILGLNNLTTTTYTTTFSKVKKESDGSGISTLNNIKKIDGGNNGDLDIVIAMNASGQIFGWGDNNQYGMLGTPKATGSGSNNDVYGAKQIFTSTTASYNKVGGGTASTTAAPGIGYSDVSIGGHFIIAFYTSGSTSQYWYQGHNTNGSIGYNPDEVVQSGTTFGPKADIDDIYAPTYLNAPSGISFSCSNSVASISVGTVALTTLTKCSGSASPSTTFTISGTGLTSSINVMSPSGYEISTASSGTYTSTLSLVATSGTISTTTLYVRLSAGASDGSSANIICSSGSVSQSVATPIVTINSCSVSPTITKSGTLSAFVTCVGTASASQSFSVTASDLTTDLTITAPTGYQVSTSETGTYSNTLTVAASSGTISATDIWVRLTGVTAGNYTGTVSCVSTGATSQTLTLTGTTGSVGGTVSGTTSVTSATNTNTLTLSGYIGNIQWQSSTDNITYSPISGATSDTYTAINIAATTYYKVVVTNGSCASDNSNVATITFDNGCYSFGVNDFALNGNATLLNPTDVRLTLATGNQNGSIWNKNKVNLDYDFDIATSINLGSSDGGADGIAFVLQNYAVNAGSTGGGLGYQGITPSFAVEFDTYFNGGNDPGTGSDHIAIVKNGLAAIIAEHSAYAAPYYVEMEDGLWHNVRFVWTASTKNFKVYWNGNSSPLYNITVDLKASIFSNNSNVFFGLTAATGGSVNLQQVKVTNYCLVKQVAITLKPGDLNTSAASSFCAPATVVLEASPSKTYLWYKNGVPMPDSTSNSIIVSTSGVYKVAATDLRDISSTSADVVVNAALPGTISGNDAAVCSGTNSTLLTLTGSSGNIQWQKSANGSSFAAISGATSLTYTATNLTALTYYKAVVTNSNCTIAAGTVSITVNPASVAGTISGSSSVCTGTNSAVLTLSGYAGDIQWVSSSTLTGTYTPITGATSATYTATDLIATTFYKAVVTNTGCSTSATTASAGVISVNQLNVPGTITGGDVSVCGGATNSTTLKLLGTIGSIQWQTSSDNVTFTNISGATSANYVASNVNSAKYFRAVVSSGACSSSTSASVSITIIPASVAGTISGGNVSVCAGSLNSTTMTLAGNTGTIQWQSSTDNLTFTNISGATTASYTENNLAVTKYYRAMVTSGACSSASSVSVVITASQCIVANPDINGTFVNTLLNGNVNTNDKTTFGTTYSSPSAASKNPSGATLTMSTTGAYTFITTLPGKYVYYFTVCAAGQTSDCAISTLEISVTDPNSTTNPPLAKNDYSTLQVNTPAVVKVLSNDKVGNPGTLLLPSTMTVSSAPVNGTAAVNTTTGVITFTPNIGFTGTDSLNYNVCDNGSPSNCQVATVYFKVSSNAVLEYTTADDDFNTVNMNATLTGNVLTNDFNSAGNTITVSSNTTPLSTQGTINMSADGSYTFTPTASFFGPVDISYTACTIGSVCATATLHILVTPVKPLSPKPINGTYTSGASTNPANISSTVTNVPIGSKVIYCNVSGLSCSATVPTLPTVPGIYVWCVKSLDTLTSLTSSPCVYDTLRILPKLTTINASYLTGVAANPANINGLVTSISTGSVPKWCDVSGLTCSTTAPTLPTASGTYIWCVKAVDIVSGLVSASCVMDTVTILTPYTVLEITKTTRAVKSNPDGSFIVTFAMKATNKTDAILDSVTIKDNLAKTFNTFSGISVYSLETFGGLVKNSSYDGISNIELISNSSKINAKSTDSLILKVLVISTNISGNFLNTSLLNGKTKYGVIGVESNDPSVNATDTTKRSPSPFVVPLIDVIIAGGFSPNQDGINDKWVIVRPYGSTIEVKVFNRWGNVVYQNADYKNDWTGRGENNFSGDYVPEGTYFYTVNAIDRSGAIKKFTSSLTIVR